MSKSVPSDAAAALLAHVISQLQHNVDFLVAQNYISPSDASAILAKLPSTTTNAKTNTQHSDSATGATLRARALWGYNENGEASRLRHSVFISLADDKSRKSMIYPFQKGTSSKS